MTPIEIVDHKRIAIGTSVDPGDSLPGCTKAAKKHGTGLVHLVQGWWGWWCYEN